MKKENRKHEMMNKVHMENSIQILLDAVYSKE